MVEYFKLPTNKGLFYELQKNTAGRNLVIFYSQPSGISSKRHGEQGKIFTFFN